MNKPLADKWVRKSVFDAIDGMVIDGETIPVYDTRVTGPVSPDYYIIMSTQTSDADKSNKCEWFWETELLIDVRTTYEKPGNTGSRKLVDDMLDAVRDLTQNLILDASSGLSVVTTTQVFPNDLVEEDESELTYRKFLRLQLLIK